MKDQKLMDKIVKLEPKAPLKIDMMENQLPALETDKFVNIKKSEPVKK